MSKFFKVYDEFVQDWEWWNYYPHHPLFEWLLTRAKVRDTKVRGTLVRRGSVLTTWNEMQQAVSNEQHKCSRGTLSRALEDLKASGDITLIADCKKTVITICKYDCYCGRKDDIWTANGLQTDCKRTAPPIINKSIENKYIYSAHETVDVDDGFVTESDCRLWMQRYTEIARSFGLADSDLPQQLTAARRQKIGLCVRERGRGTVDAMFQRLAESAYYFDQGSRGFRGDFTNLWSPSVFDKVLEGSFVPRAKKEEKERRQSSQAKGSVTENEYQGAPRPDRREQLEGMVGLVERNPDSRCRPTLVAAYESGELARLGIDWSPNNGLH